MHDEVWVVAELLVCQLKDLAVHSGSHARGSVSAAPADHGAYGRIISRGCPYRYRMYLQIVS